MAMVSALLRMPVTSAKTHFWLRRRWLHGNPGLVGIVRLNHMILFVRVNGE